MKAVKFVALCLSVLVVMFGCSRVETADDEAMILENWEDVVAAGTGQEVTILMWGGNDNINLYMDDYVSTRLKDLYDIELKRVPMNAPEFLTKLLNEKKSDMSVGTADLIWVNGENFRSARQADLLYGPFVDLLPNLNTYYDTEAYDNQYDMGIEIEGYEAIWGKAQLVLTYDSAVVEHPPKSFEELLIWAKENPGKFTYPNPEEDFVGAAFVRMAYYELTGEVQRFNEEMTKEEFLELSEPVVDYFTELNQYLWHEGQAYPATQAQQDDLFKNGEVYMTMGFEVGKTPGMIQKGIYPDTAQAFVFDTGTIGNSHYLAVPYNAPNKAAALLVIDFLESPEAQFKKMEPDVWGDMLALDVSRLNEPDKAVLDDMDLGVGGITMEELSNKRLPEMKSTYIDWIKILWKDQIGGK